jgi:mitogen-activated protein kinase 1/3
MAAWKEVDVTNKVSFRVPAEFEFVKKLGSGAFATAAAFKNKSTGKQVAVKKIEHAFKDLVDGKRHLREVQLLRQLKHDNIVSILDMFMPESRDFNDIYIVQDLMDSDLHKVIQSKQTLEEEHQRFFVYQILLATNYLHSANLVHRDIKPANVLVNKNCDVKLCDFGLARAGCAPGVTDYVVTRWWRAPEVVLLPSEYDEKVDIWSIGCVLAELIGRVPIFQGKDYLDQIKKIFRIVGTPSDDDLVWLPAAPCPSRGFIAKMPPTVKTPWSIVYPKASSSAVEVLDAMLCVNPLQRASAKDASMMEYFQPLHTEGDLRTVEALIHCEVDSIQPTKHWLQNAMFAEVCYYNPEACGVPGRVVQLHPSGIAEDGTLAVSCCGAGGDILTTITAEPGQDISALRATLSRHLDEPPEFLQLFSADGRLLNRCDSEEHQDARLVLAA